MKFRLVNKKDFKKIQRLFQSVFKRNISKKFYFWRYLDNNSFAYVNNSQKIIFHVGFLKKKFNDKKKVELLSRHSSMVADKFQRKGIYSSFLNNFIVKKFRKKKYFAIITWPNKNNFKTLKKIKFKFTYKKIFLYSNKNLIKNSNFNLNILRSFKSFDKKNISEIKKLKSEVSFFYKDYNYIQKRYIQDPHQTYYYFLKYFGKKLSLIIFSLNKINQDKTLIIQDYFGTKSIFKNSLIEFCKYFSKKNISITLWKNWNTKNKPSYLKNFRKQKLYQNVVILHLRKKNFMLDKYIFMPGDNDIFLKLE